jgi:acyl-CoA thioester hydrolase
VDDAEFETEIPVRFRDADLMNHVNDAVYATCPEEARTRSVQEMASVAPGDIESVLASLSVDFHAPVEPGEPVTVAVAVDELGTSSITMAYVVRGADGTVAATAETVPGADGTVAATAECVQVASDRETESSRPVPAG